MPSAFSLHCDSASSVSRSPPSPCVCSVGWSRRVSDFVSAIATGSGPITLRGLPSVRETLQSKGPTGSLQARTLPQADRPGTLGRPPTPGSRIGVCPAQGYNRRHKNTPGGTPVLGHISQENAVHRARALRLAAVVSSSCLLLVHAVSAWSAPVEPPALAGIPVAFILFAVTLIGIALFHHYTLPIAVGGLVFVSLWQMGFSPF